MPPFVVRASKFRHVFGAPNKRDQCFDNAKVSRSAWDTNLVKANPLFVSVNWEIAGGGAFAVIPHESHGKLPDSPPLFLGHSAPVLDTDFSPFNDHVVASASEDTRAMVWVVPAGGPTENVTAPSVVLTGHGRKVGHVLFNTVAENVLATTSTDLTVKIWDIVAGAEKIELTGHTEIIQSAQWNWNGSLLVTTSKDKKLRIFDVRAKKAVAEADSHVGVKGSRGVWFGDLGLIGTTGFGRTSDRQAYVWDPKNMKAPIKQLNIDTSSGMIMPYFDNETRMLYLAGKGDGNIRYYEWDEGDLHYLSEYKSSDPQRGVSFLPKRAVNAAETEVARAFKVHTAMIEPISFRVPRKADTFASDLFPDCPGAKPALTGDAWFSGKTANPILVSLEHGAQLAKPKEFVTKAPSAVEVMAAEQGKEPQNEKEYMEAYHRLRQENEDLKNQVTQRDIRIRQLEALKK